MVRGPFVRLLRLRLTVRGVRGDVRDEIRFHLESRIDDLRLRGLSPENAREQALREFGDIAQSQAELIEAGRHSLRRANRQEAFMSLIQDLKYAARGLARRPGLTTIAVAALTLGIGANAVMFGVVDQLMLRPPSGISAPDGIRRIYYQGSDDGRVYTSPVNTYRVIPAMRANVPGFAEVAGFSRAVFTLGRGPDARSVDVQLVSGNFFRLLGTRAQRGRFFTLDDDVPPNGEHVVVLSDGFWRRELAGREDVLGLRLDLNRESYTIVGVAPPRFTGIDRQNIDLWIPVAAAAAQVSDNDWYQTAHSFWISSIARLAPGVDPDGVAKQATVAYRHERATWDAPFPDTTSSVVLGPLVGVIQPGGMSADSKVSLWLMGVSIIVLLIVCANVANLLIARTLDRRREIAVRLALGVSRGRLLRQLLTESVLLALLAAIASIIVAHWGARFVEHVLLPGIVWSNDLVDTRVLAATLATAIICILLCGLVPAAQGVRGNVADGLKLSARQVAGSRGRLRGTLLLVQAALSVMLMIGAGLFVRSLQNVAGRDVGITLNRVLLVSMNLASAGFAPPQIRQTFAEGAERIRAIPGVDQAAVVASAIPLRSASAMSLTVPGVKRPTLQGGGPYYGIVQSDFFATTGARIIAGRPFTPAEERSPSRVVIVNDLIAKAYWPGRNPVGDCVRLGSDSTCSVVVGVAQNVMLFSVVNDDRAMLYIPPSHPAADNRLPGAILVRTKVDPNAIAPLVHSELQHLSSEMPFVRVASYADLLAPQLRPWRLGATMFTLFGAIALMIATIGLYSVLAYWVSQRQHELGVRIALGAQRGDVVRLVVRQAARPIGAGLIIGGTAAALSSRWIGSMLYETSPHDPLVYTLAAAALAIAAICACVIPARRSTSVDPATALRAD